MKSCAGCVRCKHGQLHVANEVVTCRYQVTKGKFSEREVGQGRVGVSASTPSSPPTPSPPFSK